MILQNANMTSECHFGGKSVKLTKNGGSIADTALNFNEYIPRHVNYNRFSQFSHLGLAFAIIQDLVKFE